MPPHLSLTRAADGPFGKSAEHEAVRQAKAVQLDRLAPWLDSATAVHAAPHVMCVGPREWALSLVRLTSDGGGRSAAERARADPSLLAPPEARWRWVQQSKKKRGRWRRSLEVR